MVDFQSLAGKQGANFEKDCKDALEYVGWTIDAVRKKFPVVEIDIIATNKNGIPFYITCKGSIRGPRAGFRRTDTVKKAVAEAYL